MNGSFIGRYDEVVRHGSMGKCMWQRIKAEQRMRFQGFYPPPPGASEILGLEVSGEVVERGARCRRFELGDRVFALLSGGGYAEFASVDERLAMSIPNNLGTV